MNFLKKHLLLAAVLFISAVLFIPQNATAQWSIGVSYELRDEDPKNGFGLRLEREILTAFPMLDFGLRAHFSYFNENNLLSQEGFNIDGDFNTYDVGITGLVIFNIGLLRPFAGAGIGLDKSTADILAAGIEGVSGSSDDVTDSMDAYLLGTVGAFVDMFPFLSPFIEFRHARIPAREDFGYSSYNRVGAGLTFRF